MALKLWKVYHPNYMMVIVIAETKKDAVDLVKSNYPDWDDSKLNARLICEEVTNEFVSERIDVT
jgi:hypothetical protein